MSQDPSDFDRLVEQQDQELARDGQVSPFTRLQLHAYAEGKPVPHVWDSPAMRRISRRLLRRLRRAGASDEDEDDCWEEDDEETAGWPATRRTTDPQD